MTLFFQSRTIQIQSITSLSKNSQTIQNWEQTKSILKDIYATRYLPEYALDHEPTKPGTFIDNGDGVWFEFYKGVINAQKRSTTLDKLEKFFISFSH